MARLTIKLIESLNPNSDKKTIWDDKPVGLGLKVSKSGKKTFILKYRNKFKQQRKYTIGKYGVITLDEARKIARKLLSDIADGKDPSDIKKQGIESPTMIDLFERYLKEHSCVNNKPNTHKCNESFVRRYLVPKLGKYKVKEIQRKHIFELVQQFTSKSNANNAIAILSKAFNLSEIWGWRDDNTNPCRHVKKYPVQPRQRFLTKEEVKRLNQKLEFYKKAQLEPLTVIYAIKLLLLTGCRLNEILTLKWDYINLDENCFRLPDSKTGAKTVYFSNAVGDIIKTIKRLPDNPYLIIGDKKGQHLKNLQKPWRRIRKDCGLEDVRIHDLRHSFASMAAMSGMSLPIIGSMLGHSQPQTTAQYVHLMGEPMREAVNAVNKTIMEAME